jgi:hypothetical protein
MGRSLCSATFRWRAVRSDLSVALTPTPSQSGAPRHTTRAGDAMPVQLGLVVCHLNGIRSENDVPHAASALTDLTRRPRVICAGDPL